MKIKKITIHGFKSFVDKVSLKFPSGTSAIIGPNGCGKSNIVDAVRWVIGEQNPRHLRGKLMEDVIFNGSDTRKPLSMAEVVLTFSNESGNAGARFAGFSEIEIARRLYRSGESEYYLNKVQCRLRDITDLFTDTGIGTRAYSIVEQGQVGWLISAKAEDRRVIFEEAAGINKFKQKKEAALRRLESTRENLTRVSDIIGEVKRQLNSLNRQAKKAERYKVVKEELTGIDLKLSSIEFASMTTGLTTASKRLDDCKDEEAALWASTGSKEALQEEIKGACIKEEEGYRGARDKVIDFERRIQDAESTSALAGMRVEELRRNALRLAGEIEELERAAESATNETAGLKGSLEECGSVIKAESQRVEEGSAGLDALLTRLREKEDEDRGAKAETLSIATRLADISHSIKDCLGEEERLRTREAKAGLEREETARTLASKEEPVRLLKEKVEGSRQKRASVEAELVGLGERLLALEDTRAAEVALHARIKDEYAKAGARLSTLEEMERSFENVAQGARSIMQKAGTNGIHGLMADVIDTNPGFERALEAVMGERLQYVIVESQAQGVEAIEYLKAHDGGRSSFIPVRESRPLLSPVPAGAPGHPHAKELRSEVTVKDGYSRIVDCLLGDTLVVEDLDTALDIWRQNGMYKTLVTMDGEVVSPEGVITGGKTNGADTGVFQRRSEVKTIRKTVSGLETSLGEAAERLGETVREIDTTRALADSCRDRLHGAELESVNMEAELNRQEEEGQRLGAAREALASEIADAALRLAEISTSKTGLNAEGDSLEQARGDNESRVVALATEIASIANEKEGLSGALTELKVSLATARERYGRIQAQIGEKESLLRDIENRTLLKTDETAHGTKEIAEKLVVVEELRARVDELLALIDGAKAEEIKRRESLSELTERLERIEAELRSLKAASAALQGRATELTIELKEIELNIKHLQERITERYGVEIASVEAPDPGSREEIETLAEKREELRGRLESMGEVSLSALEEYNELESRYTFLLDQRTDLQESVDSIHAAITRINRVTRERFTRAFEEINAKFKENFPRLFSGGRAELRLADSTDVLEAGIEIVAQPPGKRLQNITLLSGGEKALTAIALIFSIFLVKPSPFCMLDEVDAPLDDANIDKFNSFVREMSATSQFLLITHNKRTMEMVDSLYGITMEEPGVSKVISVSF